MIDKKKSVEEFEKLLNIMDKLRASCPWDRKQTPQTMVRYLVEEVYELLDAVESGDFEHIREELGDVLFLIVFLVHLFEEQGRFGLQGVVEGSSQKMIRRHPHVFGND
ncbi:MAG TPA: MazG nucleotide pyrophosphohydrolase domain-containing protein, partial [Bacteroidales bacterium]|nr:MazG nucleotide pyrophosphohydrolase domain-containing protein [Bacteroidales bacterium]